MAEYSYLRRTRTSVLAINFTASFSSSTNTVMFDDHTQTFTYVGYGEIGSYTINGSGDGYIRFTETTTETCYVSDTGALRYEYGSVTAAVTTSNVTRKSGASIPTSRDTFLTAIRSVTASCDATPDFTVPYTYSGTLRANIDFTYSWTVNGTSVSIPSYATAAAGDSCSASAGNCLASSAPIVGNGQTTQKYATFVRFGNLTVTGSAGSYAIQSDVGTAYKPSYDVLLTVNNRYIRGGTIPNSEFLTTVGVIYDNPSSTLLGTLAPSESAGARFSCGTDSVYASVYRGGSSVSNRNANLNGTYGAGGEWFAYSFPINSATPGAKTYSGSYTILRVTAPLNPGMTVYSSVPALVSGYAVSITAPPTKGITGTWSTMPGGYHFSPATGYTVCGYRWLTVAVSSTAGARVTVNAITKTIAAGGTATFTVDRYSDGACLLVPPASLGSPAVDITVVSGTITPGSVTATHNNPDGGNITGASIYFSRTDALPTGSSTEGSPHTLGMLCLFSGGCPGLRLNDMPLSSLIAFFAANLATGIDLTLSSGSLTPAANTREAAFYNAGLYLSSLNNGLPFYQTIGATASVFKLAQCVPSVTVPHLAGDVVAGGDFGPVAPITFANICPTALFYTLSDGLEDNYAVNIRDATGTAVHETTSMHYDTFGFLVPDPDTRFVKTLGSTNQVNVVAGSEIKSFQNRNSGAFVPV